MELLAKSVNNISDGSNKIMDLVKEVDLESKNVSLKSNTVAKNTENQSEQILHISNSSNKLMGMAKELDKEIQVFKI